MIQREFEEKVLYDTIDEVKEDFIAHKMKYKAQDLDVARSVTNDGKYCLIYTYKTRGQEVRPAPKQLPADIIATYSLTLISDRVDEISEVMNNLEDYYPGMQLYSYGITQSAGQMATAMVCLTNFEQEDVDVDDDNDTNINLA